MVRANNIFQKVQQQDGLDEAALLVAAGRACRRADRRERNHELWSLVLEASRLDEVVEQVIRTLEFSVLAKYVHARPGVQRLRQSPILNEERDDVRQWRAAAVIFLRNQLMQALDLMGVAVPARM